MFHSIDMCIIDNVFVCMLECVCVCVLVDEGDYFDINFNLICQQSKFEERSL